VQVLSHAGNKWDKVNGLENLNNNITHMFEEDPETLWMCALDKVYRVKPKENWTVNAIEVNNPNFDQLVGLVTNGRKVFANGDGLFEYQAEKNGFVKIDSSGTFTKYFASEDKMWYRNHHGWNVFGTSTEEKNLGLLNLFPNIRFLNSDRTSDDLWIITSNNELYKFATQSVLTQSQPFPLVLQAIRNGDLKSGSSSNFTIEQDNSSVAVEVVQPDYLAAQAIEYRYHLQGLEQPWTDWSQANYVIEIPYLPSGDYVLEVEAKDIFGHVEVMNIISLNVVPPYWKRPWFYALQFILFTCLVILSFRISNRYRIVSRILMLLSIIMLIQFIETIIGQSFITKTSPVIDFFIQVIIAMVVLPVEGYLRDLMFRSLETNHPFHRFLSQKANFSSKANEEN
jgi:hypothetical protein